MHELCFSLIRELRGHPQVVLPMHRDRVNAALRSSLNGTQVSQNTTRYELLLRACSVGDKGWRRAQIIYITADTTDQTCTQPLIHAPNDRPERK